MFASHRPKEQKKINFVRSSNPLKLDKSIFQRCMELKTLHSQCVTFNTRITEIGLTETVLQHHNPNLQKTCRTVATAVTELSTLAAELVKIEKLHKKMTQELAELKSHCINLIKKGLFAYLEETLEKNERVPHDPKISERNKAKMAALNDELLIFGVLIEETYTISIKPTISLINIQHCFNSLLKKGQFLILLNEFREINVLYANKYRQQAICEGFNDTEQWFKVRDEAYALENFSSIQSQLASLLPRIQELDFEPYKRLVQETDAVLGQLIAVQTVHEQEIEKRKAQLQSLHNSHPHHLFKHSALVPPELTTKELQKEKEYAQLFFLILLNDEQYMPTLITHKKAAFNLVENGLNKIANTLSFLPVTNLQKLITGVSEIDGLRLALNHPQDPIDQMVLQISSPLGQGKNKKHEVEEEIRSKLDLPHDQALDFTSSAIIDCLPTLKNQRHKLYCTILIVDAHLRAQKGVSVILQKIAPLLFENKDADFTSAIDALLKPMVSRIKCTL